MEKGNFRKAEKLHLTLNVMLSSNKNPNTIASINTKVIPGENSVFVHHEKSKSDSSFG